MNTVSSPPSPTIASEKEPVQATSGASDRVCDHPVTERAATSAILEEAYKTYGLMFDVPMARTLARAALLAGQVIANEANLLRSQPEPASEKECGKAVGEKRVWCELCGFAVLKSETEGNCSYWDCPIDRISAPPAASLIAKGEGE